MAVVVNQKAKAIYKYSGQSAQKVRLVANLIRGMQVEEALNMLKYVNKTAAKVIYKTLNSAKANAEVKNLDKKKLFVETVLVNEAPTLKRFRIASRRGYREVLKRSSHVVIEVVQK